MSLSDLFSRRRKDETGAADGGDAPVFASRALPNFLTTLAARPQPLLLDLGPVVGANVTFFGEELGCKIVVEDLFSDIDRHTAADKLSDLPSFFERRFAQPEGSVDAILCWDIFDYVNRPTAQTLARQLTRILRPDGVLYAQFANSEADPANAVTYTKYVVVDRQTLQHRPYGGPHPKQRPLANRDVQRLFEALRITDQFLMKNNFRELLFRKPAAPAPAPQAGGSDSLPIVPPGTN